jgi:hypothetical protein
VYVLPPFAHNARDNTHTQHEYGRDDKFEIIIVYREPALPLTRVKSRGAPKVFNQL